MGLIGTIGQRVRGFAAFLYDFVIGDDWMVAVGVGAALAVTYGVSRTHATTWWIMPAAVGLLVPFSLWRITRERRR